MSRAQGPHAKHGDASASREQGPREAGMRPSASRSRPPERTLHGTERFVWIAKRWSGRTPVATVANAAGRRQEDVSGFRVNSGAKA